MRDQLHSSAVVSARKGPPPFIGQQAGWAAEPVWDCENCFTFAQNRTWILRINFISVDSIQRMVFGDKVFVLWGTDLMFSVSDLGKLKIFLISVRCKGCRSSAYGN